ncbi:MAG: aminoglycoside phosphotransferase family protein [Propionibacteriaceae bacterium]|nr:aminoglycoside phosphotransferase family protein [Propionibacteriaceae bacterium]
MTAIWLKRLLDADWLSAQLGRDVTASRLRVKPMTSITAAVETRDGQPAGWVRLLWPKSRTKAAKTERAAAHLGLSTSQRDLDGVTLQAGPVLADPKLLGRLHAAGEAGLIGPWQPELVLRYNPQRRVVLRQGRTIVRVTASVHPLRVAFDRFVAQTVPTPERLDDGGLQGISVYAFTGDGDLAALPDPNAAAAVGRAVAKLHATTNIPQDQRVELVGRGLDPLQQARIHARLLNVLAPELAQRVRMVARRLRISPTATPVLSHGDLSPDQVLVDSGNVWLTDFDRACLAPRAADLGSFLAVVDDATGARFLDGYQLGGGILPSSEALRQAVAGSLVLRAIDPLRLASPTWESEVAANLDRVAEVLA